MTRIAQLTPDTIREAATLLAAGDLVAFPTETVYGLGADATNPAAIAKVYEVKQRPAFNPLIVHVASLEQAQELAEFNAPALSVARALWPGPVTLVLKASPSRKALPIAANATAGLDTIAVRMPAHPAAIDLIKALGRPIAAPSANPSGQLSPTTALHVAQSLKDKIPLVLAGGATQIGVESTVLDLTGDVPKILRPGAIGIEELLPVIGNVAFADAGAAIKAPGQLKRHYATKTTLRLNAVDVKKGEVFLAFGKTNFIGVEGVGFLKDWDRANWRNLSVEGDLHQAATHLYAYLHELDQLGATAIAVQAVPKTGLGIAINDRLQRASVPPELD